jgi:hypothetical protein
MHSPTEKLLRQHGDDHRVNHREQDREEISGEKVGVRYMIF